MQQALKGTFASVVFYLLLAIPNFSHAGTCTIVVIAPGSNELVTGTYTQSDLNTCAGGSLTGLVINSSATLTLNEAITVSGDVTVNGTITHTAEDPDGVNITATNLTIASTGSINANGKGCLAGSTGLNQNGYGPNTSTGVCAQTTSGYGVASRGGGGHGGAGGMNTAGTAAGSSYGSALAPTLLGSGGASGPNAGEAGGAGGGRIKLDISGTLTVNGNVSADGASGSGDAYGGGGGSGGSVYILAGTLTGGASNTLSANGGSGLSTGAGGGGGGGRVAVYYDSLSGNFSLSNITATKGTKGSASFSQTDGSNGTTFIVDRKTDDGSGNVRITSGFNFPSSGDYSRTSFTISSGAVLTCDAQTTLTISTTGAYTDNGSTWTCSNSITTLNLSVGGTLATTGISWTFSDTSTLNLSASTWTTSGTNTFTVSKTGAQVDWDISNNLTLNNLTYTGPSPGTSSANGGVLSLDNAISISLVSSTITSSLSWTNLTGLTIDSNSALSANSKGCGTGSIASDSTADGYGPNASGICTQSTNGYGKATRGGAAHGGTGGTSGPTSNAQTTTYGSNTAPTSFGSGGGMGPNAGETAGAGGGKIRLGISGTLTLSGSITANGGDGATDQVGAGGGSGGSIYITTTTLSGSGTIRANGGSGKTGAGGGGGGGRVAIYYDSNSITPTATGGAAGTNTSYGVPGAGTDGTVYTSLNPKLSISSSSGHTTTEASGTSTFTVALTTQPTSDVTVSVSSTDTTEGTVSPSSLTFTSTNYSTAQTVTLTGVDDNLDDGNISYSISLSTSSSDSNYNSLSNTVTATNSDNDTAGVTISNTSLTVTESGTTATYTVYLNTQPTANVTMTPSSTSSDISLSPSSLTFTSSNYGSAQTMTLTAVNDSIVEGSESATITHSASSSDSNYSGISISSVSVAITDNDTAGVTLSTNTLNITEDGSSDTYTVVLTSEPTSNIIVTIGSSSTDCDVSPSTLTFTASNWNTAQTITVTATQDDTYEGNESITLSHTASSTDSNYNGISIGSVTVNLSEEGYPEIKVPTAPDNGTITLENNRLSYALSLQTTSAVTVSVQYATSDGTAIAGQDYIGTSGTLTWNAGETGSKTIQIELLGDYTLASNIHESFSLPLISNAYADEIEKTILLNFSNPSNVTLSSENITLTIKGSSSNSENSRLIQGGGCTLHSERENVSKIYFFLGLYLLFYLYLKKLKKQR